MAGKEIEMGMGPDTNKRLVRKGEHKHILPECFR